MKILFDIGHPAHVHLFKNLMYYLKDKNIHFDIVTRNKEMTNRLLDHYRFPYRSISNPGSNMLGFLRELLLRDYKIYKLYRKNRYILMLGTSVSIGHISFLTQGRSRSWNFSEDDDEVIPLQSMLSYPTSNRVINPDCLKFKKWKENRILIPSYHELAYLHPNNFTPDESVLKKYGLTKGKYVIFRLSALKAHHDVGAKGINTTIKEKMIHLLHEYDILESFEGKEGNKIEPWDMHHLLFYAKMIISDSQTMTIEGAVLGTPALRINTFIGKSTVLDELENRYKLSFGFFPNKHKSILDTICYLLSTPNIKELWEQRRQHMLSEKIDMNAWMIEFFKNETSL
jgi:predicted glycosyltransferase